MDATDAAAAGSTGRGRIVRMAGMPKALVPKAVMPKSVTTETTCVCGQALDCCHTSHCPRCGITVHLTLGAA